METWEAIKQPPTSGGSSARCRTSKPEGADNWIWRVMVRLLSAKWWEKRMNRCWDRLQEHIAIPAGQRYAGRLRLRLERHHEGGARAQAGHDALVG